MCRLSKINEHEKGLHNGTFTPALKSPGELQLALERLLLCETGLSLKKLYAYSLSETKMP